MTDCFSHFQIVQFKRVGSHLVIDLCEMLQYNPAYSK
jgi:hypothetical protein